MASTSRLLVPGANDVWFVRGVSRASYRPLLEAGIRVFEWNGPMMHAKTAVADLQGATEVVQGSPRRASRTGAPTPRRAARGSAGRMAAGAIGIGSAIGAAVTNHRFLGPAEARILGAGAPRSCSSPCSRRSGRG